MRNEAYLFNEPEWRQISSEDVYARETDMFTDELWRELTALPTLLVKIRTFCHSPDEAVSYAIHLEAVQLRKSLKSVTDFVDQALQNGYDIVEGPPKLGETFLTTIYRFSSKELASICVSSWGTSIIINTIIARFLPADTPASVFSDLQDNCLLARQRILMSCEYAQQFRPFGAHYLSGPLMMAYLGATAEEKTWMMHQLWRIGELMNEVEVVWDPFSLECASKLFYGEPIVLPTDREHD
jgi:hypothetical protein